MTESGAGRPIRSEISRSSIDRIEVRGFDLSADLMGHVDLGGMAFLDLMGRLPDTGESVLFNAMLVALAEHGITPSTLATRLTYTGAPESLQGAVAAGLLGLGSVFVGTIEGAARTLQQALSEAPEAEDLDALAREIVDGYRARRQAIPGLGHPIHKRGDPRTARLFELAGEFGRSGRNVTLMERVAAEASERAGRALPINVTGAVAAVASELGIPWEISRGIGVMARSVGLVAHIMEEMRAPMGMELWRRTEAEAADE